MRAGRTIKIVKRFLFSTYTHGVGAWECVQRMGLFMVVDLWDFVYSRVADVEGYVMDVGKVSVLCWTRMRDVINVFEISNVKVETVTVQLLLSLFAYIEVYEPYL